MAEREPTYTLTEDQLIKLLKIFSKVIHYVVLPDEDQLEVLNCTLDLMELVDPEGVRDQALKTIEQEAPQTARILFSLANSSDEEVKKRAEAWLRRIKSEG